MVRQACQDSNGKIGRIWGQGRLASEDAGEREHENSNIADWVELSD